MTTPKLIFISHATKDDVQVDSIAQKLQLATHTVWVDHHGKIPAGTPDWDEAIRKAIVVCDVGVLVMTENALTSRICRAECLLVQQLGKPLYIIHAEKCKPENVWLYIKMIQYADVTAPNFDRGMDDILRAINGETDPALPTPIYIVTGMNSMIHSVSQLDIPLRGRDSDVNLVRDWLKTGGLVQIIAVGGLGKSRLCAEIALTHPHGAVWHKCGKSSTANEVFIALREHLNLSVDAKEELVADKMAERRAILVIDNAEDVTHDNRAGYIELFSQLGYRGVPMLLTSREKWHSNQFANRAYTLPDFTDAHLADVMQMTHDFIHKFGKHFTDDEAKQLAKAGRLHPELIEIAVGLIGGGEYDLPTTLKRLHELHPNIQKALDEMITNTLMQMKERTTDGANAYDLIHRLTWVQASFTSDVIAVFKPDSITEDNLPDALATLRRYQFLRYDDTTKRYRIPDLVRDTIGTPKDPALFGIYADFYTQRAKEIFEDTPIQDWADQEGGANVDDIANIKALGAELMRQTQNGTVGDLRRAYEFARRTTIYVNRRMEAKAWAWTEMGIAAVRGLLAESPDDMELKGNLATLLSNMGGVYSNLGEKQKALGYYEQALPIIREVGYRVGEARTLNNIGSVYDSLEGKQKALGYYEQALLIMIEEKDKRGEAGTLNNIGMVYDALGEKQKALGYYEQALLIMIEEKDKRGEAVTLNNIGMIYQAQGKLKEALEYFEHSLPIRHEVSDIGGKATTLNNMGMVYQAQGKLKEALEYFEQALELFITIDAHPYVVVQYKNIGMTLYEMGRLDDAIRHYESAIRVMKERKLSHTGTGKTLADLENDLAFYKLIARLADIYKQVGEAGLRELLKQSNAPDEEIDEIITVVVAHIARDGGDADL